MASGQVKKYVETEASLPSAVTVGSENVTSPQFLYLLTKSTTNVNSGISSSIAIKNLAVPSKPSESVKSGTLTKSQYITLANSINQFINTNGRLPNFANTNSGYHALRNINLHIQQHNELLQHKQKTSQLCFSKTMVNNQQTNTTNTRYWCFIKTNRGISIIS